MLSRSLQLLQAAQRGITSSISPVTQVRCMSKIVDAWAQPPEPSFQDKLPEVRRLLIQSKSPIEKQLGIGPDGLKELVDAAGVSKVMLCAWSRPEKRPVTNEQIAQYTKAYPDTFIGVGAVDLVKPLQAVKELDKCVQEYGFKALRVLPWIWNMPPTTNYYYPLFVRCVELDIPFCTQVGHTGPLCPSEPGRPVPYIDQVALDFPDLKILCGHIGFPWTDEMLGLAWKHANVYIDTSAHAPRYYQPQLLHYMNTFGSSKVLFGTNYPQLQFDQCVEQVEDLPLSDKARERFLWKNANKLFKLGMEEDE